MNMCVCVYLFVRCKLLKLLLEAEKMTLLEIIVEKRYAPVREKRRRKERDKEDR